MLALCPTLVTWVSFTALPGLAADQTVSLCYFSFPGKYALPTFWAVLPPGQKVCSAHFLAPSHSQHGVGSKGLHVYESPEGSWKIFVV